MTGGSFTVTGTATNDSKKLHLGAQVCPAPPAPFLAHPSPIQIFLAGLALQLISFFIFTLIFIRFLLRVRTQAPHVWSPSPSLVWWRDWRTLAAAMSLSCVGILVRPLSPPFPSHHLISLSLVQIRSAYRTVELSQGFEGPLAISEKCFYGLDTFPLFLAISVYVPFWPTQFLNEETEELYVRESKNNTVGSADTSGEGSA